MTRLDDLRQLYDVTWESIMEAPADKRSPLIGQMRAILVEIDQLQGDADGEVPSNGLIDFQAALAERQQSKAKQVRRSPH